jgi:hypothetical protein
VPDASKNHLFGMNNFKLLLRQTGLPAIIFGLAFITLSWRNSQPVRHIEARKLTDTAKSIIDTDKFSIALPGGWRHLVKETQGFKILFLMSPPVDGFSPNVNVLTEDTHGASMEEYMTASDDNMKSGGMIKDGSGVFESDGTQGRYTTSTMNYQGHSIALKSYVFIKNGLAYVLTGSCLVSQENNFRPIFDQIVTTFKIK